MTLILGIEHKHPEPRDEPSPTGFVHLEHGESRGYLLTPDEIDPERSYPLITVLHGAGRQDEQLAKAYRDEPEKRDAFFLIPRSIGPTWDLIARPDRPDLEFLGWAYDLIYRRYPIDAGRQALVGYSDGASYGLSLAVSNPEVFRAIMGWAAGFCVLDPDAPEEPKPWVLLEYGTHDQVFPFEQIAVPMREQLQKRGYPLEFRVDEGGKHWPPTDFQPEALDWFFSEPWQPRS